MTAIKYTHPKDCPDHGAALADRKQHETKRVENQQRQQAQARADWFDWYPRHILPKRKPAL